MRISHAFLPLVAATLFIVGCGNKEPATNAVSEAEASMERLRPEGTQYAPQEFKAAEATLAQMKTDLAKEDYKAVLTAIPKINDEYKTTVEASTSMKTMIAAAQNEWQTLNQEVPAIVTEVQARVDTLSSGKLPKEITKETLASAKTEFDGMKATWAEATAAASAGDTLKAADKGRNAKVTGEKLKDQLNSPSAVASVK